MNPQFYHNDLLHFAAQAASQMPVPNGLEGFIVPGSFNPDDGTVHVTIGNTYAINQDEFDAPLTLPNIRISTGHIGTLGGPIGGERCVLHPVEGGFVATLVHDEDDAPGVQAGEWWAMRRQDPSQLGGQPQQTFVKLQNDGVARVGGQNRTALIAPRVALGYDDATDNNDGVMRISDGQQLANNIINAVQTAFNNFAKTVQQGSGAPPPILDQQTATGSGTVYAKD